MKTYVTEFDRDKELKGLQMQGRIDKKWGAVKCFDGKSKIFEKFKPKGLI